MKKINVFCVLVLALMLIDLVVDLFFATSDRTMVLNLENESLGSLLFILFVALLALGAVVVAIVSFVKFILNVNRNEVFTERNIKQIRKYGYSALVCGVCIMYLTFFFGEGFFALLMAEIFCIGKSR